MDLDPSRLRRGEWVAGAGALVLLASLFALSWYAVRAPYRPTASLLGVATSPNGWTSLSWVRWLLIATIAAAFALVYLQARMRAPALPVSFSVIALVLAFLSVLALVYKVLINVPGTDSVVEQRVGAYVGLVSAIVLFWGAYKSTRVEGIAEADGPPEIETVRTSSTSAT